MRVEQNLIWASAKFLPLFLCDSMHCKGGVDFNNVIARPDPQPSSSNLNYFNLSEARVSPSQYIEPAASVPSCNAPKDWEQIQLIG